MHLPSHQTHANNNYRSSWTHCIRRVSPVSFQAALQINKWCTPPSVQTGSSLHRTGRQEASLGTPVPNTIVVASSLALYAVRQTVRKQTWPLSYEMHRLQVTYAAPGPRYAHTMMSVGNQLIWQLPRGLGAHEAGRKPTPLTVGLSNIRGVQCVEEHGP